MIAYKDCSYSLYISYAHDDDLAEFGWVQSLRNAITQRLDRLDNYIPKLALHLRQDDGPSCGTLGSQSQDRVAKSFGMLLVIGKKYVSSERCEKELKFFRESFGEAGMESRLYIAVMSEDAVMKAQQGEQWKKLMPADLIWVPMFNEIDHNRPLPHTKNDGSTGFPTLFFNRASKIADKLIEEIEKDYAQSKQMLPVPDAPNPTDTGVTTPSFPHSHQPYEDTEPFIFISYKSVDLKRISPILETIQNLGYRIWYDKYIPGGSEWDGVIEKKIIECAVLLFFLSPESVDSKHCRREVRLADRRNIKILSIFLEPTVLGNGMEMLLTQYQFIDINKPEKEKTLDHALRYLFDTSGSAQGHEGNSHTQNQTPNNHGLQPR